MHNPHSQSIRSRERYERDGPFVRHINDSKDLQGQRLWKGQAETSVSKDLGNNHRIVIIHNVIEPSNRVLYLQHASDVPRVLSEGNCSELHYTRDGSVPSYANVNQPTAALPKHVMDMSSQISDQISQTIPENVYTVLDTCTDIQLSHTDKNGGALRVQSDFCAESKNWGCTALLSFGQTRWIRFSKKNAQGTINIAMPDNSVILMYGEGFQEHYQYQIDELPEDHPIGTHLMLKIRYRKPYNKSAPEQRGVFASRAVSSRAWLKTEKRLSN